jgi:DNA mismatch repair protein MutS2
MDDLIDRGVTTLVTTHHPELKIYGTKNRREQRQRGIQPANARANLPADGRPARAIQRAGDCRTSGLPKRIIEGARALVAEDDLIADDLLGEIHKKRDEARRAAEVSMKSFTAAESLRAELRGRLENIENERREILAQARADAEQELEDLRAEIRRVRKQLGAAGQPLDVIRQVEQGAKDLEDHLIGLPQPVTQFPDDAEEGRELRLGDLVWVSSLNAEGQITELTAVDAEVAIGRLRLRARLDELAYRSKTESKREKKRKKRDYLDAAAEPEIVSPRVQPPGLELDLRGESIEDSLPRLEDYLDAAYLRGCRSSASFMAEGTGVRTAVRDWLHGHPLVKNYETGKPQEGGDGVTVVKLAPNR